MEIDYTVDAANALMDLATFIENKNTKGAGLRWLKKFELFLQDALRHNSKALKLFSEGKLLIELRIIPSPL